MLRVKGKEKILKLAREKWYVIYKRTLIRVMVDFSSKTLQARSQWDSHVKSVPEKTLKTETKAQSEKSILKN